MKGRHVRPGEFVFLPNGPAEFFNMGCNQEFSRRAIQLSGCVLVEETYAGHKIRGNYGQRVKYWLTYAAFKRGEISDNGNR